MELRFRGHGVQPESREAPSGTVLTFVLLSVPTVESCNSSLLYFIPLALSLREIFVPRRVTRGGKCQTVGSETVLKYTQHETRQAASLLLASLSVCV